MRLPASWVPAAAVTAVCLAAFAAVVVGVRGESQVVPATPRPAADAPVDVVRAPLAVPSFGESACRTCALGAGGVSL